MNPQVMPGVSPGVYDMPDTAECFSCESVISPDDDVCEHCGYPLKATKEKQANFLNERDQQFLDLQDMGRKIYSATQTLYVLSGLCVIWGFGLYVITAANANRVFTLIGYLLIGSIYAGMALWSKRQPLAALVCALVLYLVLLVLSTLQDPANLVKGIIAKVIILIYLVKGIRSAAQAEQIRREIFRKA